MNIIKEYKEFVDLQKNYISAMTVLNIDNTIDYVIEHCKEFIDSPVNIYRHVDQYSTNFFRSEPIERKSRDNANYYTLMMDNSKFWEKYPKRGKSFICSLDNYSKNFLVIPEDNSKWGICPKDDIFYSFGSFCYNIARFFECFVEDLSSHLLGNYIIRDDTIENMKTDIKKFENYLYGSLEWNNFLEFELYIKDRYNVFNNSEYEDMFNFLNLIWGKDIFNSLENFMKPAINEFSLVNYTDLNNFYHTSYNECWTDSKCVFINRKYLQEFLEKLGNKVGKKFEYDIKSISLNFEKAIKYDIITKIKN